MSYPLPPRAFFPPEPSCASVHSVSDGIINGRIKGTNVDAFRESLSSSVSSSSEGSGHGDNDATGDVYIWGEGIGANLDYCVPKLLESAVTLDVQSISCGRRHAGLVTRQGQVFTWGEEHGGRLGHGIDHNVSHPKLLDGIKHVNIELVACGEYHSCAVSVAGDLYHWGNSGCSTLNHKNGCGAGAEASQWVPRKLKGTMEGIHVSSVSCGPWHTAVVTSSGQLFTFGDGTFGVLGHGDRETMSMPREVESLKGLRTMRAACGVWHTAAVVEVIVGTSNTDSSCCSGKLLFTWGDGDKGRLGHGGNMEAKLVPTCVAALGESNFCQVGCGHSMTVAVTTTGHVYTMGSVAPGQLGNPHGGSSKGPTLVLGKLADNFVEELACGSFHVAVLTSNGEVYTWGKGANGRLGHGDTDDRNAPTLVEGLKDKQVRSVVCGTSFTAAICLLRKSSVSGGVVDQSMCSGCRLSFNFKRKRHNCYNCGRAFCRSCTSRKSLKAAMAPNPNKWYRVCDHCFGKLRNAIQTESTRKLLR
ncbi:unnamed protein product [Linum trigynum]|uniref:FYVE-type domain-containing protein n=1 Tax=Linum trigynum TaxID=586398 RepID=A0AAV2D1I2_9ROSI